MWITKLGLFAAVTGLAVASATNNYEYAAQAGTTGAIVALSADAFKFFAPMQIAHLVDNDRWIAALTTLGVWTTAVTFSLVAAISINSHKRNLLEGKSPLQARTSIATTQTATIDKLPALRLAVAQIEAIKGIRTKNRVCGFDGNSINPNGKTTRKHCPKWLALKRELETEQKLANQPTKTPKKELSGNTIEANAIADFLSLFSFQISPQLVTLLMVYLWVGMIEIGSSFGSLALSSKKEA